MYWSTSEPNKKKTLTRKFLTHTQKETHGPLLKANDRPFQNSGNDQIALILVKLNKMKLTTFQPKNLIY